MNETQFISFAAHDYGSNLLTFRPSKHVIFVNICLALHKAWAHNHNLHLTRAPLLMHIHMSPGRNWTLHTAAQYTHIHVSWERKPTETHTYVLNTQTYCTVMHICMSSIHKPTSAHTYVLTHKSTDAHTYVCTMQPLCTGLLIHTYVSRAQSNAAHCSSWYRPADIDTGRKQTTQTRVVTYLLLVRADS